MRYFTYILIIFSLSISAQKYDANIFMGNAWNGFYSQHAKLLTINYDGLKIKDIKVSSKTELIGIGNSSSTYSDSSGKLMYYSNGAQIRNRNNQILENGVFILTDAVYNKNKYDEFGSGEKASSYFLPSSNPRFVNFIFANDKSGDTSFLYSFRIIVIDTLLNKVISNKVFAPTNNYVWSSIATKHANGRDWWIVLFNYDNNEYSTYLLSDTLIKKGSITKNTNILTPNFSPEIRFNTKGNKIILSGLDDTPQFFLNDGRVFIADFDRCTGIITNIRLFENSTKATRDGFNESIFSSDDSKVYRKVKDLDRTQENYQYIIQYDLDKNNAIKTIDTLFKGRCCDYTGKTTDTVGFYPQVVLGIDGRMYYKSSYQNTFGCINFPNKQGKASKVMPLAHNFYPCYSWFPYFPNYRLGPIDGSSCDTLGINNNCKAAFRWDRDSTLRVEFTDLSYYEPQKWKWDFGDGTTSQDTSPIHTYARSGTYRVCLTVMNANGMDTYCTDVNIINTATETPSYSDHHMVKVYPNPASDFILIEHEQVHGLCKLKLYDALGQEVHTQYLNIMDNSTIIPLDKLASGVYYYTLTMDGEVQVLDSGKIILVDN
jgi:hypothetical protein